MSTSEPWIISRNQDLVWFQGSVVSGLVLLVFFMSVPGLDSSNYTVIHPAVLDVAGMGRVAGRHACLGYLCAYLFRPGCEILGLVLPGTWAVGAAGYRPLAGGSGLSVFYSRAFSGWPSRRTVPAFLGIGLFIGLYRQPVIVLRLTPPLSISEVQLELALQGLNTVFKRLEQNVTAHLARFLRKPQPSELTAIPLPLPPRRKINSPAFAFLIHYTQARDILTTDPGLACLFPTERQRYQDTMATLPAGVVFESPLLRSATGAVTRGWLIALGMLPEQMMRKGRTQVCADIAQAVDLAASLGAQIVGLGAFTSIFSHRGAAVTGRGPAITTGNTLTAGMAFAAIKRLAQRRGLCLQDASVGVLGARGAVGALCARLLARAQPRELILVDNPASGRRQLVQLAKELLVFGPGQHRSDGPLSLQHRAIRNLFQPAGIGCRATATGYFGV